MYEREPFYLTAGTCSDTWVKQQEGWGMEAENTQKAQVHMRPWYFCGTAAYKEEYSCICAMRDRKKERKNNVGRMGLKEVSRWDSINNKLV